MTDIVEWLRRIVSNASGDDYDVTKYWNPCTEAADEIERLRAQRAEAELAELRRRGDGTTHGDGCETRGPKHYECAMRKLAELRARIEAAPVTVLKWDDFDEEVVTSDRVTCWSHLRPILGKRVRLLVEEGP